jgi:hypothetical protein
MFPNVGASLTASPSSLFCMPSAGVMNGVQPDGEDHLIKWSRIALAIDDILETKNNSPSDIQHESDMSIL